MSKLLKKVKKNVSVLAPWLKTAAKYSMYKSGHLSPWTTTTGSATFHFGHAQYSHAVWGELKTLCHI